MGNPLTEKYGCNFSEEVSKNIIYRVRSDFERFQTELFHKHFIATLNNWCHSNGLLSRVQCYGRGLYPLESSMRIDIPECETWMRKKQGVELDDYVVYAGRAHSFVNKFVASGSRLAGNGRVSCEEITNVARIFQTTLKEIKVAGDMSNISGVNHSVLHGFNYSPREAEFPGWVKFGTFFSEYNTLWPYFPLWFDYKARISAVLQNSVPQADVALLPPVEDMRSVVGQQRDPFPDWYPSYARVLCENLHQNGNGCDYVSENVIQQSSVGRGRFVFGPRSYKTLILISIGSIAPETAEKIEAFVSRGGKVICIGGVPYQSLGFRDAEARDARVKSLFSRLAEKYPDRFVCIDEPAGDPTAWWQGVQRRYEITPYVKIDKPSKWLTQNYYRSGDRAIFFFANFSTVDHRK